MHSRFEDELNFVVERATGVRLAAKSITLKGFAIIIKGISWRDNPSHSGHFLT